MNRALHMLVVTFLVGGLVGACTADRPTTRQTNKQIIPQDTDGGGPASCGNGKCEAPLEDCDGCPKDCGACNGCQAKNTKGCKGCACEACVCKKDPKCCTALWDATCVGHCKSCGSGCGFFPEAGMPDMSADKGPLPDGPQPPDGMEAGVPPKLDAGSKCGDKFCDPYTEDCLTCNDCKCGCDPMLPTKKNFGKGCGGCKNQNCTCSVDPYCCKVLWDRNCAIHYKFNCKPNSCGAGPDFGVTPPDGAGDLASEAGADLAQDMVVVDMLPPDTKFVQTDMTPPDGNKNGKGNDWLSNGRYTEAGKNKYYHSERPGGAGGCAVDRDTPAPPALLMLSLLALGVLASRRRKS